MCAPKPQPAIILLCQHAANTKHSDLCAVPFVLLGERSHDMHLSAAMRHSKTCMAAETRLQFLGPSRGTSSALG